MYGSLKQSRIRAVLAAVERQLRLDSKIEAQELPSQLTIEHIMPREWRTFWDPEPKLDPSAAATRDALVNTIGNLTLITGSLNSSLKHRPWTDNDAAELKQGGSEGQGKRSLLEAYSILMMNKKLVNANKDKWTEQQIRDRAIELTNLIIANWPGPNEKVGQEPSGEKIEGGNNG